MSGLNLELRHALRLLRKSPGYTLSALVVLALGIGVNSALFSVFDAIVLHPVKYENLDRLVSVMETELHQVGPWNELSPANFLDYQADNQTLDAFAAIRITDYNLASSGPPDVISAGTVTPLYFEILNPKPAAGRYFLPEETAAGADGRVAVLSYRFWQTRFGGDPRVVGSTIRLNGQNYTVTGIASKELQFPIDVDLWTPYIFGATERNMRTSFMLYGVARLKPGVSVDKAQADLTLIAKRLQQRYPESNTARGVRVLPLPEFVTGPAGQFLRMQLGAVAFVLLIACANVANLQLARGASRRKEFAVRAALGASHGRLLAQVLTEGTLLAAGASVLSLVFAAWGIDVIRASMPPEVVRFVVGWDKIALDWRTLAYTMAIALGAGLLTSLLPALRGMRPDLQRAIRDVPGSGTSGRRLRSALVIGEVALAVLLLAGASMIAKGFVAMLEAGRLHQPASLLTFRVVSPPATDQAARSKRAQQRELLRRQLEAIPGVTQVSAISMMPYSGRTTDEPFSIVGDPPRPSSEMPAVRTLSVLPGYFATMRIPLIQGRAIDVSDTDSAPLRVVVSRALVRKHFEGRDPIGQRIRLGGPEEYAIIGVAEDVIHHWFTDRDPIPTAYYSYSQMPTRGLDYAIRTPADPMSLVPAVRKEVAALDREQPVVEVRTLARGIYQHYTPLRYTATLMGAFSGLALVLACIGIYAVISYVVAERTHEIGIRMALGATQAQVRGDVLTRSMKLVGIGLVIGITGASGLAYMLSNVIYGVALTDVTPYLVAISLFIGAGLLAAWVPARRATRIDPMIALRQL
ncbi:MAG: ABC transporter permease [Bryobacterales bacterium]|nr:ABC transporter permease [Bryobacterales bacterium]